MPYLLGYTRMGEDYYNSGNDENYPGMSALNCDVNDSMHLAFSRDGEIFEPLRNNTGVLFPEADLQAGVIGGVTKTLIQPWLFRREDGGFGVCAVRRNQNAPDDVHKGSMMLFFSEDMIHYSREEFLKLGEREIQNPHCIWDGEKEQYYLEWEEEGTLFCGYTANFTFVCHKETLKAFRLRGCETCEIDGAVPGNELEISEREGKKILAFLGEIRHVGNELPKLELQVGKGISFAELPKVICRYNDGSVHEKKVMWNRKDYQKVDFSNPGSYFIKGEVQKSLHEFPFIDGNVSDPYICCYDHYYYMVNLDLEAGTHVWACKSSSIEGLKQAERVKILFDEKRSSNTGGNYWAPELHIISGVPYIFTTIGVTDWNTTRSCVYQCTGNIMDPKDWQGPYLSVRPDGTPLRPDGVSLDMTYFEVEGIHYVMWSDRVWADKKIQLEPEVQDCADIYIASVNPERPWELTKEPVCIRRPVYGWERYETKVDEGPFLIRRGKELYVTISGSSTGLADLYCVGILHATAEKDLLAPESWDYVTYPVLTKESVQGEWGPGHNCFVRDEESGDDLLVYHSVPHDENGRSMGRHMGIRRVHWGTGGYPYLEMTAERDLAPSLKNVILKIEILEKQENAG